MAVSLPEVLRQFKTRVADALSAEWIEQACQALGITFRRRLLDPVTLCHIFLLQILHGNTACAGLRHLAEKSFSAAAYVKARTRLPLALFAWLLERVVDACSCDIHGTGRWRGHRTWLLDGSSFSMPDTPELQQHFGQHGNQKKGCGFPVAHILTLFHAGTGLLQRVLASPLRTHDMAWAALMHPEMLAGDVLIADRGFSSYVHLAQLFMRNLHGLLRCHQRQIVDFSPGRRHTGGRKPEAGLPRSRWLKSLGPYDQVVEYVKPDQRPKGVSRSDYDALPDTLILRELRYWIDKPGYRTKVITLVTTLIDAEAYPAEELATLYGQRWQVETNLRHLKTTMKMEVLHCKTVDGVLKELTMFALAYNLVRLVMLEAASRQGVALERISFVDALRWLRTAKPGTPLPELVVNPHRPHRFEPRVVKRRPKSYRYMTKPRGELRKRLATTGVAA
jgi:Transposase DDE domain